MSAFEQRIAISYSHGILLTLKNITQNDISSLKSGSNINVTSSLQIKYLMIKSWYENVNP